MPKTRRKRGSSRTRRAGTKSKRGGSLIAGLVGALKTALPSIVLYEALRSQKKRTKRGGSKHGRKRTRRRGRGHKRRRRRRRR